MLSRLHARRSAITFDLGAAGIRVCQCHQRPAGQASDFRLSDSLELDHPPADNPAEPPQPGFDAESMVRLIERGDFRDRDLALVLSPPEVQFHPLMLPPQALAQGPSRVQQALKWEVSRESHRAANELEVRYWELPGGRGREVNVMAVAMPSEIPALWCTQLREYRFSLRRIEVSPCALVRAARCLWSPNSTDLWGVLDMGLRRSVLTVIVGTTPTYIRSLSTSAHDWTRSVAEAFEVSYSTADRLKREHGVGQADRRRTPLAAGAGSPGAADLPHAMAKVLDESFRTLSTEIERCFAYVMRGFPDLRVRQLLLAGGGARLAGLPAHLESKLDIPVVPLCARESARIARAGQAATDQPTTAQEQCHAYRSTPNKSDRSATTPDFDQRTAAAFGAAVLDVEATRAGRRQPARSPAVVGSSSEATA